MRVLLTGATGFIGKYVASQLQAEGVDIVTVSREVGDDTSEHIQADLLSVTDYVGIVRKAKATHLIHLAWYTEHGKYWSSLLNVDWIKATAGLIDAFCREGGKHVTVSGSCAEYDWDSGYCTEDVTPINPATIYGSSKYATHRICENICANFAVPLAWGRVFFPYGKGEPETRLLPSLAAVFEGKNTAFGVNRESYRDFLHVTDVANALVILSKSKTSGVINISSGEAKQLREVVFLLAKIMSVSPDGVLGLSSSRPGEPHLLVGNNDRLRKLGWQKRVDLSQGLEDFLPP
jgi:nucleoside-diphosphate-sugar epimerase